MDYEAFLKSKVITSEASGFKIEVDQVNPLLFDWQRMLVRWSVFKGKAALFEACGLGKTFQQIEWARMVCEHTGGDVLILAPLAVTSQTYGEGLKLGVNVNVCRSQAQVKPGINITNYEMLDAFDAGHFAGVVLDESSILKSFMGKTKRRLMEAFARTPYRLCCTATPSPNDHMELLNHSDFLGIMPANEALSRWFINDTMNFGSYRLKGHAAKDFWRWVSTWAVCLNKPSDIGYDDNGFILPPLNTIEHIVDLPQHDYSNGKLFRDDKPVSATELYAELRKTAPQRCQLAADLVNANNEAWVVWCNTNDEAQRLTKLIPGAVNVHGSMKNEAKEAALIDFIGERIRVLVTKPSMCGFGLNLQFCHNMAFVGLSFSFEQRYQAVRRCWRFGQKEPVNDHVILSPAERHVFRVVLDKEAKHGEMSANMVADMRDYQDLGCERLQLVTDYERQEYHGDNWRLIVGDSVQEIKTIPDESVGLSIFSPPFSNLYIYSDSIRDMGNSKNDTEFMEHFGHLVPELFRITVPGRLCAIHCKDLVDYKNRDGRSGLRDFSGEIIRLFESYGWKYHSRVTIWKDPVIEMQRTKAQGLLHTQAKRDSTMLRQGLPDYLVIMRKWPENGDTMGPAPVKRPAGFGDYVGTDCPEPKQPNEGDRYSIHVWQRYASPVWFDVHQTNVLNCRIARDSEDEKHICPLQLDVIERCVHLWSNPGDTVFSPFAGVGSELYGAVSLGRKALGIELKPTYAEQAAKFLTELEAQPEQIQLFA
jgi:DNA modification methylase